jgi:hypothetical protein
MAPRADRPTHARPRRRRLLAAILTGMLALSVGIPTALAHPTHAKPHEPAAVAAPEAPASAQQPAATAAPRNSAPTAAPPAPGKSSKHAKRPDPAVGGGAEAGSRAPVVPTAGGSKHDKSAAKEAKSLARSTGKRAKGKDKGGEPGSGGEAGAIEQRRAQERAGERTPTHVAPGKAKHVESLRAGAPRGPGASSAPAQPSAPLTAVAAGTTAAPILPVPAAAAPSPAAPATHARTSHRAAHRRSTRTRVRAGVAASAPASSAASAPAIAGTPSRNAAPRHRAVRAAKHGAGSPSIVAPLATTITKIVGVVPTPVRLLIGALLALALALAVRSRFAARRARRLERQRGQLLEDVGLLQAALLPVPPARLGPVGTTAAYRPAAGPGAGGDFYDIFALEDGQLAVIVGDVSGHGRKALPHTALVRFTLRAYLEAGLSPRGAVQTAGAVLDRQLGGSFATVLAATYNPRTRVLVYASAGHPPPLILGDDRRALESITVSSAPPIGVGKPTGTRQSVVSLPGRAVLCFYTDGVTEARVASELFGTARLARSLGELSPAASAADLLDHVSEQVDRRPDDMAACLLWLEGEALAPRAMREELELDRESAGSERTARFLRGCGLAPAEVSAVVQAARAEVADVGSLVVELHREGPHARATFQHDNIAYLHTRHAARQAELTVSS